MKRSLIVLLMISVAFAQTTRKAKPKVEPAPIAEKLQLSDSFSKLALKALATIQGNTGSDSDIARAKEAIENADIAAKGLDAETVVMHLRLFDDQIMYDRFELRLGAKTKLLDQGLPETSYNLVNVIRSDPELSAKAKVMNDRRFNCYQDWKRSLQDQMADIPKSCEVQKSTAAK